MTKPNTPSEEFRPISIEGFEGAYEVSREGTVRRVAKNRGALVGRPLKRLAGSAKKPRVRLSYNKKIQDVYVQAMIDGAFGPLISKAASEAV